jgi:hypothetical protein
LNFIRPTWMTGISPPLSSGGRNYAHQKGEVILNPDADINEVWAWYCHTPGKSGTWDEIGRIGAPLPYPLYFSPPRYGVSTTSSPAMNAGNFGATWRWVGGHATQDKGYIQFMCPRGLEGSRMIKAFVVGTATPEDIIIKTDKGVVVPGSAATFPSTNNTEQTTISVGNTIVIVTLAAVTLVAGQGYKIAFQPRTPADAGVTQTKDFILAWLE